MEQNTFSCNNGLDISFIPFMPASAEDEVEARIQIRTKYCGALLDAIIMVDEKEIERVSEFEVKDFYFFTHRQYYNAGTHTICVRFKEHCEEKFEETKTSFCIEEKRLPILSGGFIMFGPPNDRKACTSFTADTKKMADDDWEAYIDQMALLGIKCIIITTTVQLRTMDGENTAHYPSSLYPRSDITAKDPVRAVLRAAERNGQYVFIGLGHTYGGALPHTKEVMTELYSLYGDSPAFYGWYESEEADIRQYKEEIWDRWQELRGHAITLSPVKPFIISPYAAGENLYPETGGIHPEFLNRLAREGADFDIIAPQDMVGHTVDGGRLTVKESGDMYYHLSKVCRVAKKHLWANCEAFDFDDDFTLVPRFNGGGMDGENGYLQQIQAVHPYSEKIVTFMLNGFFLPEGFVPAIGGERAAVQYNIYSEYLQETRKTI